MPSEGEISFAAGGDAAFRRKVLMLENFTGTTLWAITGTGADFSAGFTGDSGYSGAAGMKMLTRGTDPAEDDIVTVIRQVSYPESERLVCRCRWRGPLVAVVKDFQLILEGKDGTREWKAGLKYDNEVDKLFRWSGAGTWLELALSAVSLEDGFWSVMEFAIDFKDREYISGFFAGIEADLFEIDFNNVGVGTSKKLQVTMIATALTTTQARVDVDVLYVGELLSI